MPQIQLFIFNPFGILLGCHRFSYSYSIPSGFYWDATDSVIHIQSLQDFIEIHTESVIHIQSLRDFIGFIPIRLFIFNPFGILLDSYRFSYSYSIPSGFITLVCLIHIQSFRDLPLQKCQKSEGLKYE